jgi:hypothetical protein
MVHLQEYAVDKTDRMGYSLVRKQGRQPMKSARDRRLNVVRTVRRALQEALSSTKKDGHDESEAVERIDVALEELWLSSGFMVGDIKAKRDLSDAGAVVVLDDYVTELFITAHGTMRSIDDAI